MEAFLWTLFGITAAMAIITVVVIALAIRAVRRSVRVVPEVPTHAPLAWRASIRHHARLHRQLQATVASVRIALRTSSSELQLRPLAQELEVHACTLDEQLVVAARAPGPHRTRMLQELDAECQAVSDAGRRIVSLSTEKNLGRSGLNAVTERLDALDAALAELDDRPARTSPTLPGRSPASRSQPGSS